ncbi:MAG TPA: MaoC/PaaZ C-terminal domain-containing protein [Burkholderiales bacterium]|nr:MaoC/PaaZ C-terminal domain-containing protein [Burkholderiales bacterium]
MTTPHSIDMSKLKAGDEMPAFTTPALGRTNFVRYAGASGDFNPLHHDDEFAKARGMNNVIGHGMLTAGLLGQAIARWAGLIMVRKYAVRFSSQVQPGDTLTCGAKVTKVYADGNLPRADLECWVKNQKGDTMMTGTSTIGPHA